VVPWFPGSLVPFRFDEHPFYDWEKLTKQTFGTYQGGPYSRYSCGGMDHASIFGLKLEGGEWRTSGKQKLEDVIGILYQLVCWVNSLEEKEDVPIQDVQERFQRCREDMKQICSCEFGYFRMGVFLTIVSGSGMLESGRHLLQLVYPVAGTASYNHLQKPNIDCLRIDQMKALEIFVNNPEAGYRTEEQVVEIEFFEEAMQMLASMNDRPVHL
jgi:hypothetical protein